MYYFLEELEGINFMGGTFLIEFGKETNIFGDNGTGKTRAKDAYSWLITNYNSAGKAKFPIKDTINKENNILPHVVRGQFRKENGEKLTLQKSYSETWGSDKGSEEKVHTGHSIEYKINGEVKTKGDYDDIINAMIPAELLKMLSDPFYFPNEMDKNEQRKQLELMASHVTDEYVLGKIANPEKNFEEISAILNAKSTLEARKKHLAYEIKKAKASHDPIKGKIEENSLHIKNIGVIDTVTIDAEIVRINGEISKIDEALTNKTKAEDLQSDLTRGKRNALNSLKNRQQEINNEHTAAFHKESRELVAGRSVAEDKISNLEIQKKSKEALLSSLKLKKTSLDTDLKLLIEKFNEENKKEFPEWDPNNFICGECKRKHEPGDIEHKESELRQNFIDLKKKNLLAINNEGAGIEKSLSENQALTKSTQEQFEKLVTELAAAQEELKNLNEGITAKGEVLQVDKRLLADKEYNDNAIKITKLEAEIADVKPIDYADLKTNKQTFIAELDVQKEKLNQVKQIKTLQDRNIVLAEEQKTLAQQIAKYQREDMLIDEFSISKSDLIEQTVRSKFKHVSFKMFENNIGDVNKKPTCELWYMGKPWAALNTGSKLNAGLDVVNALSTHYGIFPPLLLDNRESTTQIINTDSQVINFFVSKDDKTLRVEII